MVQSPSSCTSGSGGDFCNVLLQVLVILGDAVGDRQSSAWLSIVQCTVQMSEQGIVQLSNADILT